LSERCKGLGSAFTKTSNCCIGCCREERAGRGAEATSKTTAFFGRHLIFRKPWNRAIFTAAYSLAPGSTKPADSSNADRPGQPEPPGSTRCSMPSTTQIPQAGRVFNFWLGQPTSSAALPGSRSSRRRHRPVRWLCRLRHLLRSLHRFLPSRWSPN